LFFNNGLFFHKAPRAGAAATEPVPGIAVHDVLDGTSNTYMTGETAYMRVNTEPGVGTNFPSWATSIDAQGNPLNSSYQGMVAAVRPINAPNIDPLDSQYFMQTFSSLHPGGCHMGMADGSVHFLRNSLSLNVHRALATRADGQPPGGLQ
jgi:prepilin-type processing-associated H-X9-DG protein